MTTEQQGGIEIDAVGRLNRIGNNNNVNDEDSTTDGVNNNNTSTNINTNNVWEHLPSHDNNNDDIGEVGGDNGSSTTDDDDDDNDDIAAWRRDPNESFSDWTIEVIPTTITTMTTKSSISSSATSTSSTDHDGVDTAADISATASVATTTATTIPVAPPPSSTTYHVHRVFLASGPRCSDYFKTLFTTNVSTQESNHRTTTLRLHESACHAFPALLDYIYTGHIYVGGSGSGSGGGVGTNGIQKKGNGQSLSSGGRKSIATSTTAVADTTKTSGTQAAANAKVNDSPNIRDGPMTEGEIVALLYLADYLQVLNLVPATIEYIQEELRPDNVHLFCREALVYGIDWIVYTCLSIAAASPKHLCTPLGGMTTTTTTNESTSAPRGEDPTINDDDNGSSSNQLPTVHDQQRSIHRPSTKSPAQQVLEMLPPAQQIELLQLSLKQSVDELNRFKRVPTRWKDSIDESVVATHMPQMAAGSPDDVSEFFHQPYTTSLTGCGLSFPNKVCPVFYFDEEFIRRRDDDNDDDNDHNDGGDDNDQYLMDGPMRTTRLRSPRSPEGTPRGTSTVVRRRIRAQRARLIAVPATANNSNGGRGRGGDDGGRQNHRIIVRGTSRNSMNRD